MNAPAKVIQMNPQSKLSGLRHWQRLTISILESFPYDLSNRQMAILLTVYLEPGPHTVKDISANLKISKPAICRALDYLSKNGLIRRRRVEADHRQVHIQRTVKGSVFLFSANSTNSLIFDKYKPFANLLLT